MLSNTCTEQLGFLAENHQESWKCLQRSPVVVSETNDVSRQSSTMHTYSHDSLYIKNSFSLTISSYIYTLFVFFFFHSTEVWAHTQFTYWVFVQKPLLRVSVGRIQTAWWKIDSPSLLLLPVGLYYLLQLSKAPLVLYLRSLLPLQELLPLWSSS